MKVAVVGGGPAGLRAAEVAAIERADVTVFDAMPSVGRKFLVAGRGGLNLTKSEPIETFLAQYPGEGLPRELWNRMITAFPPDASREWASELGIETFAASTGRVYPREMKAAPLLRRWVERLRRMGVRFAPRHRLRAVTAHPAVRLEFETSEEAFHVWEGDSAVLALGGASWPKTGSTGAWIPLLESAGVDVAPLQAANCGWEVAWPESVQAAGGLPLKNISGDAGGRTVRGELMVTDYGLEGGVIYALGPWLRAMDRPALTIDLKPDVSCETLLRKLGPGRKNLAREVASRWRLGAAAETLLTHFDPLISEDAHEWVRHVKAFTVPLMRPRPIAEAISSAGGVSWASLDENLMLRALPGVYCAGEMIDWEAPTGGYLMQ